MPVTKSAKKALRQNIKRKQRNLSLKNKIRRLQRNILRLVEQKKNEEAQKLLPQFYKAVDKAAKNNVIKKNTASRRKSRIVKTISR